MNSPFILKNLVGIVAHVQKLVISGEIKNIGEKFINHLERIRRGRSKRTPSSYFIKRKTNECRKTREQQCHTRKRNEIHIIFHNLSN